MKRLEYRMYGLVPYNLSPIQQGIQYGHAVVEHVLTSVLEKVMNGEELDLEAVRPLYNWAKNDKTFIILNGGTTNINPMSLGTLNNHYETLRQLDVPTAIFYEPDLGDQLTAVVFLVDERVWDEEKYPSLRDTPEWMDFQNRMLTLNTNERRLENMGGEDIWKFRQFLKQFKLA